MSVLTPRQQQVLDVIKRSIAERGFPPTLKEIGAACGIASNNGVNDHLHALERKGAIERTPLVSRGIRVLEQA